MGGLLALFWLALEFRAKVTEAEWWEFVATWEARGEAFDVESNLPSALPGIGDEDEVWLI